MAESSMLWDTTGVGDGPIGGYTEADWYDWQRYLWTPDNEGTAFVLPRKGNKLAVTTGASKAIVATGAAMGYGFLYKNTASLDVPITTPLLGTTGVRIVLRTNWAAQTVRAEAVRNSDGVAAIPAATQTPGTTYEMTLADGTITTGGVVTLTDRRGYLNIATEVIGTMLASSVADGTTLELASSAIRIKDNGVSDAKLRDSTALSVIGRGANTSGDPGDIIAGTHGYVLMRSGTTLGFGQVLTAGIAPSAVDNSKIAANSVDDTQLGNNVAQFSLRQGGNATDWSVQGSTDYAPGPVKMYWGVTRLVTLINNASSTLAITYPAAFSNKPLILACIMSAGAGAGVDCRTVSASVTTGNILIINLSGATINNIDVVWQAVGPE